MLATVLVAKILANSLLTGCVSLVQRSKNVHVGTVNPHVEGFNKKILLSLSIWYNVSWMICVLQHYTSVAML